MLDGDVLQQPTIPVVNDTNMKKNATMKRAIIARDISKGKTYFIRCVKQPMLISKCLSCLII